MTIVGVFFRLFILSSFTNHRLSHNTNRDIIEIFTSGMQFGNTIYVLALKETLKRRYTLE